MITQASVICDLIVIGRISRDRGVHKRRNGLICEYVMIGGITVLWLSDLIIRSLHTNVVCGKMPPSDRVLMVAI
jgi:hypothetical protein